MSLGISLFGCRCRMGAFNLFRRPRGEPGKPDGDGGGVILGGGEKLNVGDNDVFALHFGGSEVDRGFYLCQRQSRDEEWVGCQH